MMNLDWPYALQWHAQRIIEKIGPLGQLVVSLLALIVIVYLLMILPKEALITDLNAQSIQPTTRYTHPNEQKIRALEAFKLQFPNLSDRANELEQLMRITQQHGLQLDHIHYRTAKTTHDPFLHYSVEFLFDASYLESHDFLADVLSAMPFVSIGGLDMKRDSVSDHSINTHLILTLHFDQSDPVNDSQSLEANK